jgi:hypothetical protein
MARRALEQVPAWVVRPAAGPFAVDGDGAWATWAAASP